MKSHTRLLTVLDRMDNGPVMEEKDAKVAVEVFITNRKDFIQNQNVRSSVKKLNNFHTLLLPYRKLPYFCRSIYK